MRTPINHHIVMHDGIPVAAVIPYDEYLALLEYEAAEARGDILSSEELQTVKDDGLTIPHEVMGFIIESHMSPARAWREHLDLSQREVAARLGITQASYSKMESAKTTPRTATLKKIAAALGVNIAQLDL